MSNKSHASVSVERSFEVTFCLPDPQLVQSPPLSGGNTLDRITRSSPEMWCLRFNINDAMTVAETLNAVVAKIVELVKENPPK